MDTNSAAKGMKAETTGRVNTVGPILDFTDNAESALLDRQTVKAVTDDITIEGEGEFKLNLVPVPGSYLYAVFNDTRLLPAIMNAMSEPASIALADR